jgi:hypothetical protein
VNAIRRRSADVLVAADPEADVWANLRRLVGPLAGSVPCHPDLRWREGVSTRLDWADDRLWLLTDPCTVFEGKPFQNRQAASMI